MKHYSNILLTSAIAAVTFLSIGNPALADIPIGSTGNGAGYVNCKNGQVYGFTTQLGSQQQAIHLCNQNGGGVLSISNSFPSISQPHLNSVFTEAREVSRRPILKPTAMDRSIWAALQVIAAEPVLADQLHALIGKNDAAAIRKLIATKVGLRSGARALGSVYVGPLQGLTMSFWIPKQNGCLGSSSYYVIAGILIDQQTNCN